MAPKNTSSNLRRVLFGSNNPGESDVAGGRGIGGQELFERIQTGRSGTPDEVLRLPRVSEPAGDDAREDFENGDHRADLVEGAVTEAGFRPEGLDVLFRQGQQHKK